jgi:uncharacterized protein (TIGR02466 family)
MELKEHILFVNSCFTTYLEEVNRENIISAIEKIQATQKGNFRSNAGGFQSFVLQHTEYDNISTQHLFQDYILPAAKAAGKSWGIPNEINAHGYWYNVNYKYNYNRSHMHPMSYISGVYYLKVPSGNAGNIIFNRTEQELDRMAFVTKDLARDENGAGVVDNVRINTEHWFLPEESLLILFPSHLSHYVEANLTNDVDDRRISLSFNFH